MHGHCKNGLIFGILVDSSRMETIRLFHTQAEPVQLVKKSRGRRIKKKYIIAIGIISNLAYFNNISVENLRLVLIIINYI